ncbi:MAG: hypothetical protein V2B13_15400 [Pseudomonadota bacterium]
MLKQLVSFPGHQDSNSKGSGLPLTLCSKTMPKLFIPFICPFVSDYSNSFPSISKQNPHILFSEKWGIVELLHGPSFQGVDFHLY